MRLSTSFVVTGMFLVAVLFAVPASAQTAPSGSLAALADANNFNRLERLAAYATQATYNQLNQFCSQGPNPSCPDTMFRVFGNVRELVETANALMDNGPTDNSLGLNAAEMSDALRWTAPEEMNAPGSVASEFANTQLTSLLSRVTALRFGASGFTIANIPYSTQRTGGNAGADDAGIASKWGGFLNGAHSWGDRDPTEMADAFDYRSTDITLGVDYRFTRQFVLGGMVGYTHQRVDFDPARSESDGDIKSKGFSFNVYGLYEWQGPYLSASLGMQRLNHDMKRVIDYQSHSSIPSVYAVASSSTDSNNLLATTEFGWPLARQAFTFEPSLRGEYRRIKLDGFRETSVNLNPADPAYGQPAGFDFNIGSQTISSFDASLGLKFQYVFNVSIGVLVPYAKAELHRNFDTAAFTVNTSYNGDGANAVAFDIPSDRRARSFQLYTLGSSMVLKRGWQGFLQYQRMAGVGYLSNQIVSGGIRGEF